MTSDRVSREQAAASREEQKARDIARAEVILRGADADIAEITTVATALKACQEFGYARRLFARIRQDGKFPRLPKDERIHAGQQEALCTYKDPDLTSDRFARALEILTEVDDPVVSTNQETLGLAGAICKRMWQVEGQRNYLERSVEFYRRGHAGGVAGDQGRNGINAAYALELLAREEAREVRLAGSESEIAGARCAEARGIREELVRMLPALLNGPRGDEWRGQWWFCATLAEAYVGLAKYEEAVAWLKQGPDVAQLPPWELESTIQQVGSLVRLQWDLTQLMPHLRAIQPPPDPDRARTALRSYLGDLAPAIERVFSGKVGLALSGGGFRASFFHVGVLAYLAERDILRQIEALSCVSGGSIIGAHYYLEVQKLLQDKTDSEVTRQDYIAIVERLQTEFLAGVQTNIRCQVLAELWTNIKAMFWPDYTRTRRIGDLYESRIFSRVDDGKGKSPRWLNDLLVHPKGEGAGFKPKYENWRRRTKVPILVLNATTLNTGHNWQFTASWMGEPPVGIDSEIDGNYRLRRMYYREAPEKYRRVRLGQAVAASACVPGLFEPLVMRKLYPDKTIRLVDGGVFDNQGVSSLLEEGCSVMLVSDAAGQMNALDEPSGGIIGVPLRAFSITMARVRQAEFHELDARRRSAALRSLMFLHLKKDLDVERVDWVDCPDPQDVSDEVLPVERRGILTRYGIRKDVQRTLSAIRTDLDSFSEIEAYALMTSGYRMAQYEFRRSVEGFPMPAEPSPAWRFLEVEPLLSPGPGFARAMKHLTVASQVAFKVWRLSRPLWIVGVVLLLAAGGGLIWAWQRWQATSILTVGSLGWTVLALVVSLLIGPLAIRVVRFRQTLGQVGVVTAATLLAAIVFRFHLLTFDRVFLALGRISSFKRAPRG